MILITGCNGFIGSNLLKSMNAVGIKSYLCASRVLIEDDSASPSILVGEYDLDVASKMKLGDVHTIIHLASYMRHFRQEEDSFEQALKSIFFTQKIIRYRVPKLQYFIYVSSTDVYLKSSESTIVESSTINVSNTYALSKIICEKLIRDYCSDIAIPFDILRLGHIFGPGDEHFGKILQKTVRASKNDEILELGSHPLPTVNLTYVFDVTRLIINLLQQKRGFGVTNVVATESISLERLIECVEEISHRKIAIKHTWDSSNQPMNTRFSNSKLLSQGLFSETNLKTAIKEAYFSGP
jgi:UDP-glucose 4-epimerase